MKMLTRGLRHECQKGVSAKALSLVAQEKCYAKWAVRFCRQQYDQLCSAHSYHQLIIAPKLRSGTFWDGIKLNQSPLAVGIKPMVEAQ